MVVDVVEEKGTQVVCRGAIHAVFCSSGEEWNWNSPQSNWLSNNDLAP